jgi:hypothetical protein
MAAALQLVRRTYLITCTSLSTRATARARNLTITNWRLILKHSDGATIIIIYLILPFIYYIFY